MPICPYCGRESGWLKGSHDECVKQAQERGVQAERERMQKEKEEEEQRKLRDTQERNLHDYQQWRLRHSALVDKFLEIADRKVSVLDDYGDENWDAFGKEIEILLTKTARADGDNLSSIKRSLFRGTPPQNRRLLLKFLASTGSLFWRYVNLKSHLKSEFLSYHENRKLDGSGELDNLTGVEFETFLARLLAEHGFEDIRGTPPTGDQGADLIGTRNGQTIVVQAKRYHGSVGNRAVQEVAGAVNFYGADEGWVITSGSFTASAKALAQRNNVKLVDGHRLRNRDFS